MATKNLERAKLLGDLIRKAREHNRRTTEGCAEVLQTSVDEYLEIEEGSSNLSLPDLEALAIYLDVPMGYFWGTQQLVEPETVDYQEWVTLRNRVIGVLLKQLRIKSRKSLDELAEHVGESTEDIEAYESGDTAVPYVHLESLCRFMGASPADFLDDERGPMGRHEARHKLNRQFDRMDNDLQQFLVNPVNVSYLDTAKRISEMDVQKLRRIAEDLLDITY